MAIQGEKEIVNPLSATDLQLSSPSKTPLSDMGGMSSALYRLKWAIGYRLLGPDSWTRKMRMRLAYEGWLSSHVKGWFGFLLWRLAIRIPFNATIAGQDYPVRSVAERKELSKRIMWVYQSSPFEEEVRGEHAGVLRFSFRGKDLAFPYDGNRYSTKVVLKQFFIDEPYAGLEVEGRDVVDIGSCIGETPIYFCLRGARSVIALEPYPATYARARQNISTNGFDDKVTLLNEGAGASGWMKLTRSETNLWANAVPSSDGQEVRFNSLKDMITKFGIKTAVLKFHGEGSEYEFLEDASSEDLAHFPQIALKYHYGATPIVRKLESAGFTITRKWDLHFSYNPSSSSPKYEAGLILAKQAGGSSLRHSSSQERSR
jgi:FkbM family methyltransferase